MEGRVFRKDGKRRGKLYRKDEHRETDVILGFIREEVVKSTLVSRE